jgi:hypothetical protein
MSRALLQHALDALNSVVIGHEDAARRWYPDPYASIESITAALAHPEQEPVPLFRGYACLGTGHYLLNHSAAGEEPEFVISVATDSEKVGRIVGDHRANGPEALIQPDAMAVRIAFASVAGLDAIELQLRELRKVHFPDSVPLEPAQYAAAADYITDKADKYLQEYSHTESDTGVIVFHCGTSGREYHNTLTELSDDLRELVAPPAPVLAQPSHPTLTEDEIGALEYRGNTVSFMYDRAKAYGSELMKRQAMPPEPVAEVVEKTDSWGGCWVRWSTIPIPGMKLYAAPPVPDAIKAELLAALKMFLALDKSFTRDSLGTVMACTGPLPEAVYAARVAVAKANSNGGPQ